ncbi:hypothetical protein F511_22602 [Dorcoceras hygrometricum]|uniref:Uncharacterized protein n=1 Tax=Dorcoceras hygrometricum TaxID=472368 RepID=A0A2Z7BE33_9LAMI|nr:hypothetical protein F511_22602 [Dorcoceras hygrometricum]
MPKTAVNGYPENDKDALKQKMIEHETVFRNQVHELHRLYRIQRDMMEEVKRKEFHVQLASIEPSSSSSQGFQRPSNDARKWHMAGFPLSNSGHGRTSILGVEVVTSPVSCTERKENQTSQFLFPNGSTSKDCEALDSRPLKVRRKLFDLQLPAEEYVDSEEGENLQDYKLNARIEPEISFRRSHTGVKANSPIAASSSISCLKSSVGLADLNKPIQIEEPMSLLLVDFHGNTSSNGETKGTNQAAKSNARFFGVTHDAFLMNSSVDSEINKRGRSSHIYEAGSSTNLGTQSQGLPQDKLHMAYNPVQATVNQLHHSPGAYPAVHCKENPWRDGSHFDEFNNQLEPLVASQSSHPLFSSRCFPGSQAHSITPWAKPKNSFTQQINTYGSPSVQEHFGGKWQANDSSRFNAGLRNEQTTRIGFSHGSACGTKELQAHLPSAGFGHLNCSQGDKVVSDHSINHRFGIFAKGSCHVDSKPVLDINLNEAVSNSLNEPWPRQDLNTVEKKGKHEDQVSALPWLRPKPTNGNEGGSGVPRASLCSNQEAVRDLNQPYTPLVMLTSNDCVIVEKKEIVETRNVQKILGFPIVDAVAREHEPSSLVSSSTIVDCPPDKNNKRKNKMIDINLAYEPEELKANEEQHMEKATQGACFIDLNSCVSDCEDPPIWSFESQSNSHKVTKEIDLEAPIFLESDGDDTPFKENISDIGSGHSLENKAEQTMDEVLQNAADTLITISSSLPNIDTSEVFLADSLLWFANTMSSCATELECTSRKESKTSNGSPLHVLSEEIDEFEAMTLQLVETKEDEYMPKPFVPEAQIEDTGANALVTRTRRGQSRRGRQRRDFQRDILPGLTSLSRHEVTEDLQTFGGMMRATGHHWNSGLTRRNGGRNRGARGRRRAVTETVPDIIPGTVCTSLVQQLNNIEPGLEDRSLTGWGKTTRRPRRQRCPAGIPPTIAST